MRHKLVVIAIVSLLAGIFSLQANARAGCTESIPDLFKRVSPAVVFISAIRINPFKLKDRVETGIGTGFIISKDGLVLTNSHVVFGRQAIMVLMDNGQKAPAQMVGADPILDLAVLRIPVPSKGLPVLRLGDSKKIRIGEEVVAVGNPLGLEQTLTRGVVSGVNRILPDSPMSLSLPFIQTDAAINPGNSGGPLLNRCGEAIGINTAGFLGAQNIGFAVPSHIAKKVVPQLVKDGRIIRPWLGVSGKLIGEEFRSFLNFPLVDGYLVETVEPGSPAQKLEVRGGVLPIQIAGEEVLLGGDIITVANGLPIAKPKNFKKFIQSLKVGDMVRLTLHRAGKTRKIEFRLPERPILPGDLLAEGQSSISTYGKSTPLK